MQKKACNTLNPTRLFHQLQPKEKALSLEWRKGFFYGEWEKLQINFK